MGMIGPEEARLSTGTGRVATGSDTRSLATAVGDLGRVTRPGGASVSGGPRGRSLEMLMAESCILTPQAPMASQDINRATSSLAVDYGCLGSEQQTVTSTSYQQSLSSSSGDQQNLQGCLAAALGC